MSKINDLRLELETIQTKLARLTERSSNFKSEKACENASAKADKAQAEVDKAFIGWMKAIKRSNKAHDRWFKFTSRCHRIKINDSKLYGDLRKVKKELEDAIEEDTTNLNKKEV